MSKFLQQLIERLQNTERLNWSPPEEDAEVMPTMSGKEAFIVQHLIDNGETYGLGFVKAPGSTLKRGTVYTTLGRMEDKGFVTSRPEERPEGARGVARRLYRVTGLGERVLQAKVIAEMGQQIAWGDGA